MKTPDEIKRGLECSRVCSENDLGCKTCPYLGSNCPDVHSDALTYIQQLERERDALREGLKTELGCNVCKHFDNDAEYVSDECMGCGKRKLHWEWRGAEEDA